MSESGLNGANPYVSTAQVAEALGVGISTVKRWVDLGILPAHKTAGGHRKILLNDVIRIVRGGDFPRLDLARLGLPAAAGQGADPKALVASATAALKRGDPGALKGVFEGACRSGMTIEALADEVIAPSMRRIGHDWAEGRIDVWHEHRGTQIVVAALYEMRATLPVADDPDRPLAVGGGPEGDPYVLANLLIDMALTSHGWRVMNLGPNTPLRSFATAVERTRPRLLWISANYLARPGAFLEQYRAVYDEATRLGTAVAVGGQALTEETRSKMPYTTFGDGLTHLVAFARSLNPVAQRPRRGRPRGT